MITKTVVVSKEAQRRELLSDWLANRKAEALTARHMRSDAPSAARPLSKSASSKFAVAPKRQK
jgi:dsDNA-binding SOS-regulon protein